jgi:hypothetical protein
MRFSLFVAVTGLFFGNAKSALAHDSKAAKPERIGLWHKRAPTGDGTLQDAEAWLTLHRPEKPNGTAIVICPGGGHRQCRCRVAGRFSLVGFTLPSRRNDGGL